MKADDVARWLPVLPDGWAFTRGKFLLREFDERSETGDELLLSLTRDRGVVPRSSIAEGEHRADTLVGYKRVQAGQLVMNKMQAWNSMFGLTTLDGVVSPDYAVFEFLSDSDPRFLTYQLRSHFYAGQFLWRSRGMGTAFLRLHPENLLDTPFVCPPLRTQTGIADFLDAETMRIDALIEKKRQMISLSDERFVALAKRIVLAGLDPTTGGGELPVDWRRCRLGIAITLHRGFDLPESERREGSVPVLSSGVQAGNHDEAACEPPGVVTGRYGTVGAVHFVEEPYWPLNTTLFVSDFRDNDPKWVYHLLRAIPLDIDAEKSAVTGINRNVVGMLYVPMPPVSIQADLASKLDLHEQRSRELTEALAAQIALLLEHRQALITAAVTGELEIEEAA